MKIHYVLGILSLFILAACAPQQPSVGGGTPVQAVPAPGVDPDSVQEIVVIGETPPVELPEEPTQESESNVVEIEVTAKQWEFIPNPIRVNLGDRVRLKITSVDVSHGFALPDFGVSQRLSPGRTETVEFTADKAGSFTFFCNVVCGSGHSRMRGTLVVS